MGTHLYASVELMGDAAPESFEILRIHMEGQSWRQTILDGIKLPTSSYFKTVPDKSPDVQAMADALKANIERGIWPKVRVLIVCASAFGAA
jgi:hypothetical protein